jgi:hypothetical protein
MWAYINVYSLLKTGLVLYEFDYISQYDYLCFIL